MPALAIILGLVAALLGGVAWKQRTTIAILIDRRRKLMGEEHRMFAFLQDLGECLQNSQTQGELHQFIIDGAMRVVDAREGALYLMDDAGAALVPEALSANCPPLFPLESPPDDGDLRSFLKLKTLPVDQTSIVGACLEERRGIHLNDMWGHRLLAANGGGAMPDDPPVPAMFAPLHFGERDLGVLAVIGKEGRFNANDFAVFRSLSNQCALGLGTAMLRRQATDRLRLEEEMGMARDVQRILLPQAPPEFNSYRIAAANHPASILSGDYFDFIRIDDRHLGVTVADVSGKGLPASLIMTMGRSVLRAHARGELSPSKALGIVNRVLFPDMREDRFISMVYLILDEDSNRLCLARAGHDPPLVYRAGTQTIEALHPPGLAVGIDAGDVFDRVTQDADAFLDPGDVAVIYTDGLNEAMNAEGEEFGVERIRSALLESGPNGSHGVLEHILAGAKAFIGDSHQSDDITLVVLEKT